jgi:hypothetical protein
MGRKVKKVKPLKVKEFNFKDAQLAWAGLNEYLATQEKEVYARGGGRYGPALRSYDNIVYIRDGRIDPNFDFSSMLGYTGQKWTSLVKNYVDLNYLDLVKSEILRREKTKSRSYNFSFHFSNKYHSGKDCLISISFIRRLDKDRPMLIFTTRATEVTKRLIFDLLLIQRIGEYVYGEGTRFEVMLFLPMMYISAEHFTYYHAYKPIPRVLGMPKNKGKLGKFSARCWEIYRRFKKIDVTKVKFKSDQKAIAQLQRVVAGKSLGKPLIAEQLRLGTIIEFPEDCISPKERKRFVRLRNQKAKE